MKIGIIADSHDHRAHVQQAIRIFRRRRVKAVLHAGDIVSPFTARAFAALAGTRFIAVLGNNDGELLGLREAVSECGGTLHVPCFKGTLEGRRIFMTHRPDIVEEIVRSGMYDLVIYGHTHQPDIRRAGTTLVVNPGETTDWLADESHVALVDLATMECEHITLE